MTPMLFTLSFVVISTKSKWSLLLLWGTLPSSHDSIISVHILMWFCFSRDEESTLHVLHHHYGVYIVSSPLFLSLSLLAEQGYKSALTIYEATFSCVSQEETSFRVGNWNLPFSTEAMPTDLSFGYGVPPPRWSTSSHAKQLVAPLLTSLTCVRQTWSQSLKRAVQQFTQKPPSWH